MGSLEQELHQIHRKVDRLSRREMPIVGPAGVVPAPVAQYDHLEANATPAWIRVQNLTMANSTWIGRGAAAARIKFDTGPPTAISILDADVGIGIDPPAARLHVSAATATDTVAIFQTTDDLGNNLTEWRNSVGTVLGSMDRLGRLAIGHSAASRDIDVRGALNPQIGVRDTTNNVIMKMQALDTSGLFGTETNHAMTIRTNNTAAITIGTNRRVGVGIGIALALAQLHIDQPDNAANIPALKIDQGDESEQCIMFSSDGADRDIYLWTMEVTGAPAFMWDESETAYNIIGADLNFATGLGITHADGVAAGMILLADGTRYVPAVAAGSLPIAPVAVGDTLIATAGPLWDILTTPGAAGYVRVSTATTEVWSQTPTMTGDWTWTSAASANPVLTIENTNADAAAPTIDFYKNSASPADNDDLGAIDFFGETSTGAQERYAYILAESLDVTNGDTGGGLKFSIVMDATERSFLELAGYNGSVNEGEIVFNQDGQDVDTRIEAVGVPNAFTVRGSDGLVGIWTDTPDGTLHVQSASAGAVTAWGGANEIVVEGIASGISMLSADIGTSELVFGSPSTAQGALASWNFSSLEMRVGPTTANGELVLQSDSGNERARFEAGGNLLMATTLDLNGIANALILDADADTTISAPTDDQIDFEVGGSDVMVVTPSVFTVGDGTGTFAENINGAAGTVRDIVYQSAGSNRWIVRVNSTAEAGANVGSDFQVVARTDAGGALATSLHIQRSTSRVGILNASPGAQLHVDQSSTTAAIPVLTLDQADVSEEMINFIVAATGAGNPVDTATAVGTAYARLRIAVNGTFKYIQLYNA